MTHARLTETHLADLRRSGLSDETIAAAGLYSLSAAEAQALLGRRDAGSGLAIPYPGCTYADGTPYVRVRLDVPLRIGDREARYLTRQGERNRLYLPAILSSSVLSDPDTPLVVTEGEKKALKACEDSIPCVGLAGVWCWRTKVEGKSAALPDLETISWQGRQLAIIFDSDLTTKPDVRRARTSLAKELARRGARVSSLDLPPGLDGAKIGLDDYLLAHTREDFECLVQAAPVWGERRRTKASAASEQGDEAGGGSQADRLVELALAEGVELFHDPVGGTFALVPVKGHREIWPCGGRNLRRWLAGRLWQNEQRAANTQALSTALNVIEAKALYEGEEHQLHNRVARHEGAIWYDLADREWRAVRVAPHGWELVPAPPILFRRYSHQQAQVEPKRGGDLDELRRFVNLRDEAGLLLCQIYLVCSLLPDIPHPIPDVHGEQGSAKTTLLRVKRRLIDPSAVEVLSLPHEAVQLAQQLSHHWAPYYDNVTDLPDWVSDVLCRAATGHGFTKRGLYTDDDDVIYQIRRCPGLNGINVAAQKPDLLDRTILFELQSIPESERRPEKAFWEEFERARPLLLGAIFDVLSKAMATYEQVVLPGLPRMADFAIWGCAAARALGHDQDAFLAAYDGNIEIRNDEAVQASPVATVVLVLMQGRDLWEGTASELLTELQALAPIQGIRVQAKDWPKAPHALTRALKRVRPVLRAKRIDVEAGKAGRSRAVRIWRTAGNCVPGVTSVPSEPQAGPGVGGRDANASASREAARKRRLARQPGRMLVPHGTLRTLPTLSPCHLHRALNVA